MRDDPGGVLEAMLRILDDYWHTAFAVEWARLEPQLVDAVVEAGKAMPGGVLAMLGGLAPVLRLDLARRVVVIERPHDHRIEVAERGPLRLTFPVVPPSPHARRIEPAQLLAGLRALAADQRLEIVQLLCKEARSTQELSGLLGLSGPAVSRHLKVLLDAGVLGARREGYYVLYEVREERLADLAYDIQHLDTL